MTSSQVAEIGFHAGELAVQEQAGLLDQAARLEGMLAPATMSGGMSRYLAGRQFAALTARDRSGRLWISPLVGPPGFLSGDGTALTVHALPADGDPLRDLPAGQQVGLITVEFATRRRVRVNGTLTTASPHALSITADQAFGNCPSYVQRRDVQVRLPADVAAAPQPAGARCRGTAGRARRRLSKAERALIASADTFFLGTSHPMRGADASHKGGEPGFVRLGENDELWWPDYAGNNMFNSLGNLAVDPGAALLFVDFTTGATVQLSGTAELEWTRPGRPGDDGGTGRRVRFRPELVTAAVRLPISSGGVERSPHNPELR